ncbi:MAG: hypothetical protein HUU46_08370 [Candidatus Hydrogenedentes bacterium]|nr:hypothetical protein [Candidatus Hydrogenedentota bacterium]
MRGCVVFGWALFVFAGAFSWAQAPGVTVGAYQQDVAATYTGNDGLPSNNISALAVATNGHVFAGTDKGLAEYDGSAWKPLTNEAVSAVAAYKDGVAVASGETISFLAPGANPETLASFPAVNINAMSTVGTAIYLATTSGVKWVGRGNVYSEDELDGMAGSAKAFYCVAGGTDSTVVAGGDAGLFEKDPASGKWNPLYPSASDGRSWAPRNVRGAAFDAAGKLWFASTQGAACYDGAWTLYEGKDGLPFNDFTGIACGPAGEVWFATTMGAIRFENGTWNYRQGRRWAPSDTIRAVAVDAKGSAWLASPEGVGLIERRPMTLAEKAKWYEDEIDKYHRRTEYQYVLGCSVEKPGDKSAHKNTDSDNDGLWTGMYGAGECFAYAATKDPKAKARAKQAFEALRFLSVAPVDGEVKQQPGFVARTVMPTTEPDPNQRPNYTLAGQQKEQEDDTLWKAYVPRWPLTKDKKFWYKTDTSSDELDGHYFFYAAYYDLVADTDEEKERVRRVVKDITDHLVRNDFCLVDHDGTPTRWAVYSPKQVNRNPLWSVERGLNSLSMLSYLTVAEHMTGDAAYTKAIDTLRNEHSYDTNAIVAKLQHGFGSGNHSDDEMAIMCYYNIVKYTKDDDLKKRMTYAFYRYMATEWPEMNPFFNFAYAAVGQGATFTNAYNEWRIDPWDGWLEDAVDTLKRFPLDRFNWEHKNGHRLDIIPLPRVQRGDPVEPAADVMRQAQGYRVNGKVLPVDERHFGHWNTNPWSLNYGGDGSQLADGAVFLMPYYMGLYHGFIKE